MSVELFTEPEWIAEMWRCALAGAAAVKTFTNDDRSLEEIASEAMNDMLDTRAKLREASNA